MIINPQTGERCDENVSDKKIKFSGPNTSTAYLLNPKQLQVEKIKVDGCAIVEGSRCDWLARVTGTFAEDIFIELKKACRIQRAAYQLEESVKKLSPTRGVKKRCVVVFTTNQVIGTELQQHKEHFKRKLNAVLLTIRSGQSIELTG